MIRTLPFCVWSRRVFDPLLASGTMLLWYAIPIVLAISLVYGATRHELMVPILQHAWRTAKWITGFMLVIAIILISVMPAVWEVIKEKRQKRLEAEEVKS